MGEPEESEAPPSGLKIVNVQDHVIEIARHDDDALVGHPHRRPMARRPTNQNWLRSATENLLQLCWTMLP